MASADPAAGTVSERSVQSDGAERTDGPPLLAIAMLSAAALGYEILLMRLFSVIQWHHFAYMMISVALLGYGAAGTFVALTCGVLLARYTQVFVAGAATFGIFAVTNFLLAQRVEFNPLELAWDPQQPWRLLAIYVLLFVPFFCAATALCLTFTRSGEASHRVYSFDILGGGAGCLAILLALFVVTPTDALKLIGALGFTAAAMADLHFAKRPRATGLALLGCAIALPFGIPVDWTRLDASEYKDLRQTLQIGGTRIVAERSSPLRMLTVVESPRVPFRYAPGLSLNAPTEPPPQLGVFVDGDGPSALVRYDGRQEPLAYLDYLTSALPYHLLARPRVLVLGAGAGADVLQAIALGAQAVDAVELDPLVIDVVQRQFGDYSGRPYSLPGVRVHIGGAWLRRTHQERFDLIRLRCSMRSPRRRRALCAVRKLSLHQRGHRGLPRSPRAGRDARDNALGQPAATRRAEAVRHCHRGARASRCRGTRPSAGADTELEDRDVDREERRLHCERVASLEAFCRAAPSMPTITRVSHRIMPTNTTYLTTPTSTTVPWRCSGRIEKRLSTITNLSLHQPLTTGRTFPLLSLEHAAGIAGTQRTGRIATVEWGYPVLIATLLQAIIVSLMLVVVPMWLGRDGIRDAVAAHPPRVAVVAVYFTAIGFAFMFIEIAFIQKFLLFLAHPLYAVAVVLCAFLVFGGLGSRYSWRFAAGRRWADHRLVWLTASIAGIALLYLFRCRRSSGT
jgi:hypothetical protein